MELIKYDGKTILLNQETENELINLERAIKTLKDRQEKLKTALMEEMEKRGIIKIETDDIVVTYIPETDREQFDSKQFRADNGDLYDKYVKMTPVKASIRVKAR